MSIPDRLTEVSLTTSPETATAYAGLSKDINPLHLDPDFAATTPFGAPIAHGTMVLILLQQAIDRTFGQEVAQHLDIRFSAPVMVGDTVTAGGERMEDGSYAVWVRTGDGSVAVKGSLRIGDD